MGDGLCVQALTGLAGRGGALTDLPRQGGTKPHFPAAPAAQNEKAQAIGLG